MKRRERRKLAFKLAKREIKKLGSPRYQLRKWVDFYMRDIRDNPERYADEIE